jgi:hypothetical protein
MIQIPNQYYGWLWAKLWFELVASIPIMVTLMWIYLLRERISIPLIQQYIDIRSTSLAAPAVSGLHSFVFSQCKFKKHLK